MSTGRVVIPGSEREFDPKHERVAESDARKEIEVTVYLRARDTLDWVDDQAGLLPAERRLLTREEFAERYAPREDDIGAVRAFAGDNGLEVVTLDPARRAVMLRGTAGAVARAFGAQELAVFNHPSAGAYRGRRGPLTVPAYLEGVVTGVFGIDERPQAWPQLRRRPRDMRQRESYTPRQVAAAYDFPVGASGRGETVAIIALGGGFSLTDLNDYFSGLGLAATPSVSTVGVGGAGNTPGSDPEADSAVMLDVGVVGAVAPGVRIVVYFAANTDRGFIDAVSTAVHDARNRASVVSISWGAPESLWTQQALSRWSGWLRRRPPSE